MPCALLTILGKLMENLSVTQTPVCGQGAPLMTIKIKINSNNGIAVQSVNSHYWVADGMEEAGRLVCLGDI